MSRILQSEVTSQRLRFNLQMSLIFSKEAEILKENGVNIIIALGHSGYDEDKKIAKNCPLVDVVIGGHSHTYLQSGTNHQIEKAEGPYPTVIQQQNGKAVPVAQTYAFTKYLGQLKLTVSNRFARSAPNIYKFDKFLPKCL